ncbi:FadR/GntR family transcriptional regulator [Pseudonocardia spinosispora]|uniref:FadR/GntR family transcriptional regulator n=1 Tax=Pseudonocardia spinosispora TaxID=103441 RepID=UPI0004273402|nr:FCD domain-containing protein [Pseudonocardia spinosispora]
MIAHFDAGPTAVPSARRGWPAPTLATAAGTDNGGTDKLAARVARDIEMDIKRMNWPVGRVLGSESELRERYQVSRAVLREAIRLVEHHRVAAMRRGPAGGLVVQAPDAGPATNAMVVYLEFVGTTVEHVLAARMLIEPLAVALAAKRINEAGIPLLRSVVAEEIGAGSAADATVRHQMHLVLAELSGNPALRLFVDVLLRLTDRYARGVLSKLPEGDHPALTESSKAHQALVNAVVAGDFARAEYLSGEHLEEFSKFILGWHPESVEDVPSMIWGGGAPGHTQDQKLAEVVARRIMVEIHDGGWPVGSVIGSESALLDRFEVSRAVLREAVRLLEYHSVARMRRGPGGGLVVAKPDPSASIDAMALYLDYKGIEIEHLRAVRERVELGCLESVAARAGEPEVVRRLRAALQFEANIGQAPTSEHHLDELPHLLHLEIAELSGNPVLSLFLRILTTLWARNSLASPETAEPTPENSCSGESVESAHRSVVDALIAGDGDLARHRMVRHLETFPQWWQ